MTNKLTNSARRVSMLAALAISLGGAGHQRLFAQACTQPCPANATDTAVAVGLSAFLIQPNGTTNTGGIGGATVGQCSKIVLRMSVAYTPNGPGGPSAAFSGGRLVIQTSDGVFSQDVTPASGVPTIGPLTDTVPGGCAAGGTNFFLSLFTGIFDISAHTAEIVNGKIAFNAFYGPNGTVAYLCPPITNQTAGQTPIQVNVAPPPICSIVPQSTNVCAGGSASFTVSATNGIGPYTFNWVGPNGFTATGPTITINNAQAANAGTYVATVVDQSHCSNSCSTVLGVYPNPIVGVNSATICSNFGPVTLTATVSNAAAVGPVTYLWSPGGQTTSSISVNPTATTTYCVTVTSTNGCIGTNCGTVTVNPNPVVTVNSPTICSNHGPAVLTATVANSNSVGPVTYLWSPGGQTTASISVTPSVTTTYCVLVTTAPGCTNSACGTVTVYPNPTCNITGPSPVCETNTGLIYTASVTPNDGSVTGLVWSITGNATITATNGASVTVSSGPASGGSSFTLNLNLTTTHGCVGGCSDIVPVIPCGPRIKVYKQVVCLSNALGVCEAFNNDLTTQKFALGVRVDPNNCPAFCYRITVTNSGDVTLSNVVVSDSTGLNLSGCGFPSVLPVGGSASCVVTTNHCVNTTNIVTATGVGQNGPGTTQTVTATDTNAVNVLPISIACSVLISTNGGISFNPPPASGAIIIPTAACGGAPYIVRIVVTNTGSYPLQNVTITNTGAPLCFTSPLNIGSLNLNGSATINCTNPACASVGTTNTYSVCIGAQASQASGHVCDHNLQGVEIIASTCCQNSITCFGTPAIRVFKQVVCLTNGVGLCEPFNPDLTTQKSAFGVRVDPNNCPAFCYRIIVTNTGCVPLTGLTVTDDSGLNLSGCGFPSSLPVGGSAACVVTTNHCTGVVNIVTAQASGMVVDSQSQTVVATDTNSVTVAPISIQCTLLVSTDNGVTFTSYGPNCPTLLLGHGYIVRTVVTNTGSYGLQNVIITSTGSSPLCFGTTNLGSLAVGGSTSVDCSFSCATPGQNNYAVSVSAEASQAAQHVCVYNIQGIEITANSQCATCVKCLGQPQICVSKSIACFLGTNPSGADVCGTFGPSAIGVQGDTQEPAFCYSITVSNCGTIPMTNVSVIDSLFGDLTADFACVSPTFAVGASCTFEFRTEHPVGTYTNVVTARGCSVFDATQCTNASAQAVAIVIPASVACQVFYTVDGGPPTDNAIIGDSNPHTIVWYVTITNTGVANLGDIHVTDEQANLGCGAISYVIANLDQGASVTFAVCTNASFVCTNNFTAIDTTIMTVADQFSYGTNHLALCSHDLNGTNVTSGTNFGNITVRSECVASLTCRLPNACRVTGGGRQDLNDPNGSVCPTDVRYVTHGGQVGAPVGNKVCSIDTSLPNYWLGNPCIHGRWTHVRHQQGGNEGNFHARFYDTLDCACLDTNYDSNCQYPTLPLVNGVCGDRHVGPLPRKAPANKIVFTGVGDWTCEVGRREPRSCLFRVDIEDRGEPGNAHALAADGKAGRVPDRYRIRIWVLTDAELAQLNSAGGADPYLIHFRDCISACNGIDYRDGVCGPNTCSGDDCDGSGTTGTITFPGGCPVRSPNVDDGGEMLHGNHQIHPMIMDCDPTNPKGPGLAKP